MTLPMICICALCVCSLLLAWVMVYAEAHGRNVLTYLSKTVASVCFVSAGLISAFNGVRAPLFAGLLTAGLVFGMLGDIYLCRKAVAREEYWQTLLTAGGAFFLTGHLCYFAAFFIRETQHHFAVYLLIPVLLAIVFWLMKSGAWKIPKKDYFNYLGYAFISGLMLAASIELMMNIPQPQEMILAAAAFTFLVSDLTLATWNFGRFHNTAMRFTCISLYYIAQILFVFGIAL